MMLAAQNQTQFEERDRPLWRLGSSLRCRSAAQTLELARPWMAHFQISRVTDVTRMDRLGLPVCISVRARSLTLHVNAGKGLELRDAQVGALMEAIETAAAEPQATPWDGRTLCIRELEADWAGQFEFQDLPFAIHRTPRPDDPFQCVPCVDLVGGGTAWMPADLVFMPYVSPGQPTLLRGSSTGIASGNSVDEATLHGLLEVLERDATTLNAAKDASWWIEPDTLPAPFAGLARQWALSGVSLAVRYVPNAFGLPCFRAVLHETESEDVRLAGGAGFHLDRHIAVSRAICEAAQSRLSGIHGGRDDVARYYDRMSATDRATRLAATDGHACEMFDTTRSLRFDAVPSVDTQDTDLRGVLGGLVQSLPDAGFPRVYRHRFATPMPDLHVVRVIVPGCEDVDDPPTHMGRRLRQRILAHA